MAYFQAMGFLPGAVIAAQQGAPLPPPQPAYGTRPTTTDASLSSSSSSPTTSPYVPPPIKSAAVMGIPTKPLIIGAAIIAGIYFLKRKR